MESRHSHHAPAAPKERSVMDTYRLHYFPESGNSYKLALMLTLCGQTFEPIWTDVGSRVRLGRRSGGARSIRWAKSPCWKSMARS